VALLRKIICNRRHPIGLLLSVSTVHTPQGVCCMVSHTHHSWYRVAKAITVHTLTVHTPQGVCCIHTTRQWCVCCTHTLTVWVPGHRGVCCMGSCGDCCALSRTVCPFGAYLTHCNASAAWGLVVTVAPCHEPYVHSAPIRHTATHCNSFPD